MFLLLSSLFLGRVPVLVERGAVPELSRSDWMLVAVGFSPRSLVSAMRVA